MLSRKRVRLLRMVTYPEGIAEDIVSVNLTWAPGERRRQSLAVEIQGGIVGVRIPRTRISKALTDVLRGERRSGRVDVIIVGDTMMRRLNRRFRETDKTTDVLSFPMADKQPRGIHNPLIGEIYCNHDHCRRWQKEHGGAIADELLRLAVHGCLHLLGYDHHRTSESRAMSKTEDRYLRRIGLIAKRMRWAPNA